MSKFFLNLESLTMPVTPVLIEQMKSDSIQKQRAAVRYLGYNVFGYGGRIGDEETQQLIIPMLKLMKSKE